MAEIPCPGRRRRTFGVRITVNVRGRHNPSGVARVYARRAARRWLRQLERRATDWVADQECKEPCEKGTIIISTANPRIRCRRLGRYSARCRVTVRVRASVHCRVDVEG